MKRIYKYTLKVSTSQIISVPLGARVLNAVLQHGEIVLYCMVDPDEEKEESIVIRVFPTGSDIEYPETLNYINTIVMSGGAFVFHVFKRNYT